MEARGGAWQHYTPTRKLEILMEITYPVLGNKGVARARGLTAALPGSLYLSTFVVCEKYVHPGHHSSLDGMTHIDSVIVSLLSLCVCDLSCALMCVNCLRDRETDPLLTRKPINYTFSLCQHLLQVILCIHKHRHHF